MQKNNKNWYSILVAIFIIWFLFVLTSSIFKLVLAELNDSRWRDDYLKAYYAAEASGEYAMLKIKTNWYWYYNKLDLDKSKWESTMLSLNWVYKWWSDPIMSYDLNSKVKSFSWNLEPLSYDVIPLFYTDDTWSWQILDMLLDIKSWVPDSLSWNIISSKWWLSGVWWFNGTDRWILKSIDDVWNFSVEDKSLSWFLNQNKWSFNYLVLFNSSDFSPIDYVLDWKWSYFTKPRTEIAVSWKLWDYKQSLSIKYDNTDYLWMLKYSIYSN